MPEFQDLVAYEGKFYGDWEIFVEGDPKLDAARAEGVCIHDYTRFLKNIKRRAKALAKRVADSKKTQLTP